MNPPPANKTLFDGYADSYEAELDQALSPSGEGPEFFARGRIRWFAECLRQLHYAPRSVLDYGCGTGSSAPLLMQMLGADQFVGLDVSQKSIELANRRYGSGQVKFLHAGEYRPEERFDAAYSNGVFHHILPAEREPALRMIYEALRPGGVFAFWENNPLNPGTRYVMSRCAFDRDAITLRPKGACQLLRRSGFKVLRLDFLFVFPRLLKRLRVMEPWLSRWPLGAQYQVLAERPA